MAYESVNNAFVIEWDKSLRIAAQQSDSRLMSRVTDRGQITGESFTINNLGTVEMAANTVRHSATVIADILHATRLVAMSDFFQALALDRNDEPKMLVNPVTGGHYMQSLVNARNRTADKLIYAALIGNQVLKDGSNIPLPAGQKIVAGGTGLTKAKVIQARALFRANETDASAGEDLTMVYDALALSQILSDTTLSSADYLTGRMLQDGNMPNWLGFTWVPYEGINVGVSGVGVHTAVAFARSGVHWGKGYEEGKVSRRPDLKELTQVSMGASYGAGRQDEKKVVQIDYV